MSELFDDLYTGLQEAIEYTQGKGHARVTRYVIEPVKTFSNTEIKKIRNNAGMTQDVFAEYLGVSQKTVEAWECGRTHPTGAANRLIDILQSGKEKELSFLRPF